MNLGKKHRAVELRRSGKTYSEIQKFIGPTPKGTLSWWLKNIELTEKQKKKIIKRAKSKIEVGREKAGWKNHQKRLERIANIYSEANQEYEKFIKDPIFLSGLMLYLAEGSKKYEVFQFMNSDPYLIKFMIKWLYKFWGVTSKDIKLRLYLHKIYSNEENENFWSKFLKIPLVNFRKTIYKPTPHKIKKNIDYKGCLRVELSGSKLYWKIMRWRDILYKSLN